MRRTIFTLLIASLFTVSVIAQEDTPIPTNGTAARPEIAYRLFSTWADNYQVEATRGKTIATTFLYAGGAISLAGSALTWYGGDAIAQNACGSPMDPELKQNLTLGLGIGGAVLLVSGMVVASVPIKDYRAIYSDIFQEKDPDVREAMAVSVLRYQSDRGKEKRIASFITSFVAPILAGAIKAGINVSQDKVWSDDLLGFVGTSSWSMAGGVVSLFSKSPEERLYERYLTTRDAYLGSGR
jgi:hypothetical protein